MFSSNQKLEISGEYNQLKSALDWLEKQGEQKPFNYENANIQQKDFAPKVEPKFKVGDWVVLTVGDLSATLQIANIDINKELYWFNDGSVLPFADEENLHLWTIKDAKEGDVLSYETDEGNLWIMLYWSLYEPYEGHVHYHALLVNDDFIDKGTCCICIDNLKPATIEQHELLFRKMKEEGYQWDKNKKELIKL